MKRTRGNVLRIVRILCACSWTLVTVLLLSPNPGAMMGLRAVSLSAYATAAHLSSFFVVSVLTLASRPPLSMRTTLVLLFVYGTLVESLQAFVPHRTVQLGDYVANYLGISAGAAAYAAAEWYRRRRGNSDGSI